jgi:hypothetical protein
MLRDSCKKSFWDGSSSSPSPPTRSSWSTRLCIVTALRQSSSDTSGIPFLTHFSLPVATSKPCVHGRCSFRGLACVHLLLRRAQKSRLSWCFDMPCRAFWILLRYRALPAPYRAINTRHSCLFRARRLQSNLSSLRCARAAAVRVNANELTNLKTAKALWAQQRSGNARPGR